jgi:hypothetical protein
MHRNRLWPGNVPCTVNPNQAARSQSTVLHVRYAWWSICNIGNRYINYSSVDSLQWVITSCVILVISFFPCIRFVGRYHYHLESAVIPANNFWRVHNEKLQKYTFSLRHVCLSACNRETNGFSWWDFRLSQRVTVFCDVAPCSLVEVYRRFRDAYCLHHQGGFSWILVLGSFTKTCRQIPVLDKTGQQ